MKGERELILSHQALLIFIVYVHDMVRNVQQWIVCCYCKCKWSLVLLLILSYLGVKVSSVSRVLKLQSESCWV